MQQLVVDGYGRVFDQQLLLVETFFVVDCDAFGLLLIVMLLDCRVEAAAAAAAAPPLLDMGQPTWVSIAQFYEEEDSGSSRSSSRCVGARVLLRRRVWYLHRARCSCKFFIQISNARIQIAMHHCRIFSLSHALAEAAAGAACGRSG